MRAKRACQKPWSAGGRKLLILGAEFRRVLSCQNHLFLAQGDPRQRGEFSGPGSSPIDLAQIIAAARARVAERNRQRSLELANAGLPVAGTEHHER